MKLKNMNKIHVKNKKEQEWKKYWIVTFCVRCGAINLGLLPPFPPHVRSLIHLASHQSHRKSNQSREIRENQCQSRENHHPSRETRKNQYWSHQSLSMSSQRKSRQKPRFDHGKRLWPTKLKRVKWKKDKVTLSRKCFLLRVEIFLMILSLNLAASSRSSGQWQGGDRPQTGGSLGSGSLPCPPFLGTSL